jgi:hypothetical protein
MLRHPLRRLLHHKGGKGGEGRVQWFGSVLADKRPHNTTDTHIIPLLVITLVSSEHLHFLVKVVRRQHRIIRIHVPHHPRPVHNSLRRSHRLHPTDTAAAAAAAAASFFSAAARPDAAADTRPDAPSDSAATRAAA